MLRNHGRTWADVSRKHSAVGWHMSFISNRPTGCVERGGSAGNTQSQGCDVCGEQRMKGTHTCCYDCARMLTCHNTVPLPEAAAAPGVSLERENLRPLPRPPESESASEQEAWGDSYIHQYVWSLASPRCPNSPELELNGPEPKVKPPMTRT